MNCFNIYLSKNWNTSVSGRLVKAENSLSKSVLMFNIVNRSEARQPPQLSHLKRAIFDISSDIASQSCCLNLQEKII